MIKRVGKTLGLGGGVGKVGWERFWHLGGGGDGVVTSLETREQLHQMVKRRSE